MPRKKQLGKKKGSYDGDGILQQKKSNSKWYYVYYTGEKDEKGKYKRPWIDLETTDESIANDKMKLIQAEIITTGYYYAPSNQLFKEWLYFWLDEIKKPEIGEKTYEDYEYIIRVHIVPDLGLFRIKDLTPEIILKFYNKKRTAKRLSKKLGTDKKRIPSEETLSSRTPQKIQFIMNASLESARKMRKIPENPIDFLEKSTKVNYKPPESTYMESAEILKFLDSISWDQWFAVFVTDLGSGLRLGEICGLKWAKVDLNRSMFDIKETRQIVKNYTEEGGKTKIIKGTPKSEKSKRYIPLPVDVVETLKKWKRQQKEELFKFGIRQTEDTYVFTWEDGRPLRPDYLSGHFKKLIRKFDRPDMTFHKLRHSYATMLLELGEEMKTIQENLGHAQLSTTSNIYAHVLEKIKARAASKLNGFTGLKFNQSK